MSLVHRYREFDAAPPLRPYVECYWEATSTGAPDFRPVELLVPDLRIEVIFNAGERYLWRRSVDEAGTPAPGFACIGMRGTSLPIQQPGRLRHFAMRFRPAGLRAFVRLDLGAMTQRCIDAQELWGPTVQSFAEQLGNARTARERVLAADAFLSRRLSASSERSRLAQRATGAILEQGGLLDIARVAESNGVGYKRLERVFHSEVGLSPKHFARIAKLQRAIVQAVRRPKLDLADLAVRAGYADQAHLTRDFTALVGRSPRAFFAERFAVFETMKESGSLAVRPMDSEGI